MRVFDPIAPGENHTFTFSFAADLAAGETITSIAVPPTTPTIVLSTGTDAALAGLSVAVPAQISGTDVLIAFTATTAGIGNSYLLTAQVNTSLGQSLSVGGQVSVVAAALQ